MFPKAVVSEVHYKQILDRYLETNPDAKIRFEAMMKPYNCSNNIPKYKILVKLNQSISKSRREYVANGIRAYYRDDLTKLVDINIGYEAIESITKLF